MSNTYSRFVYIDTGVLSHIVKTKSLWPALNNFLVRNNLTIGISGGLLAELSEATRLHKELTDFLFLNPSAILKDWQEVQREEIEAHPLQRKDTLFLQAINLAGLEPDGIEEFQSYLGSEQLVEVRERQKIHSAQLLERYRLYKGNFPPAKSGKYEVSQGGLFSDLIVMQWLASIDKEFLSQFKDNAQNLNTSTFRSIKLFALVIFYKYYLGRREPINRSDFGDLTHLLWIPYCKILITERDLCNTLNQIKRRDSVLAETDIENVDFLSTL